MRKFNMDSFDFLMSWPKRKKAVEDGGVGNESLGWGQKKKFSTLPSQKSFPLPKIKNNNVKISV